MGDATPMLVLVGRSGWKIQQLGAFLDATGNVHGQVFQMGDASDGEVAWLYQHCQFTVFPSSYEGWGLPVGESLWFGKPVICFENSGD